MLFNGAVSTVIRFYGSGIRTELGKVGSQTVSISWDIG
jgi:hypothetical protein